MLEGHTRAFNGTENFVGKNKTLNISAAKREGGSGLKLRLNTNSCGGQTDSTQTIPRPATIQGQVRKRRWEKKIKVDNTTSN